MGNKRKLLNRPLRAFTAYALLILMLSIPAYYWVVDRIWLAELDEQNEIILYNVGRGLSGLDSDPATLETAIDLWNRIQPWTRIAPVPEGDPIGRDSLYTVMRPNDLDVDGEDRFRGLSGYVEARGRHYHIIIETNVEEVDETMSAIGIVTAGFFGLMVLGFIILNRWIAGRVWQPFRQTLDRLRGFNLSEGRPEEFPETDIEEFDELNDALSRLIDRNLTAYQQQRRFLENASHELQTPLAMLRSKLDLLLQSSELSAEQAALVSSMELALSRMGRINKGLLLLAKMENNQFTAMGDVDLCEVIGHGMELLRGYAEEKGVGVTLELPDAQLLHSDRMLLETLVQNLLANAVRHAPEGGRVAVRLDAGCLEVRNTGTEALDAGRLFQRFAGGGNAGSIGLGLAIVKEVCHQCGWSVGYEFEPTGWHVFRVRF